MKEGIKIPKLKPYQHPQGGRPTLYYKDMGKDYLEYVKAGFEHEEILNAWGLSKSQFNSFYKSRGEMQLPVDEANEILDKRRGIAAEEAAENEPDDYDGQLEIGEVEAIQRLRNIVKFGKSESAQVQAAREILDRRRGKPVQETQVTGAVTYEILSAIPAAPNSGLIDVTPEDEDIIEHDEDEDNDKPDSELNIPDGIEVNPALRLPWNRDKLEKAIIDKGE